MKAHLDGSSRQDARTPARYFRTRASLRYFPNVVMAHAHSHSHPHPRAHGDAHSHGPSHSHSPGHSHAQPPTSFDRAFAVGLALNLAFVVVEIFYGVVSHSVALLSDAGHNFGDVLGLGFSWGATVLATLRPSHRRTFGYRRSTIVASTANALILLFVTGGLAWESIRRLMAPPEAQGKIMIVVALAGAAVNAISALLFFRRRDDLNIRSAFAHLAADAVLALGVALTGFLIIVTGWLWLDPVMSLILAVTIFVGTWSLMRQSMNLMLDAVPEGIDPAEVKKFLATLPGVVDVHDLHIWGLSTTETALMAHLVMPTSSCKPEFLADACSELHKRFDIDHSTLQIDPDDAPAPCSLASDETL